jgi:SNF2 family DNA or RNA helicase
MEHFPSAYVIENFQGSDLQYAWLLKLSSSFASLDHKSVSSIQPLSIELHKGSFSNPNSQIPFPTVVVSVEQNSLILSCACSSPKTKLCDHQVQVMHAILHRPSLRVFFDDDLRIERIKEAALAYGLENETDLENLFHVAYDKKNLMIKPVTKELLPVTESSQSFLKEALLPKKGAFLPPSPSLDDPTKQVIVFGKHKYYEHFFIELANAPLSKEGKIKNPLSLSSPSDLLFQVEDLDLVKFYSGISRFQNHYKSDKTLLDIEGLRAVIKNPLQLDTFYHDSAVSEKITAQSLVPVHLSRLMLDFRLRVDLKDKFHEVTGFLIINDIWYELKQLKLRFEYFILLNDTLYLIENPDAWRVIDFFKRNNHKILIHASKFIEFQENILNPLERFLTISYSYVRQAKQEEKEELGFDRNTEWLLYLSESENYVLLTPVIRYGAVEVPILSKKQIYAQDQNGNTFHVERNEEEEIKFTALLVKQHPDFEEQLQLQDFYLHKARFLTNDWFLEAFEEWRLHGIVILGFNELKGTKINPNKAKVSVRVSSGINWFETALHVSFGNQKASLKHLHTSLRNKSKFVQLGDGTLGLLPNEWIEKFSHYFRAGDIKEETIQIPTYKFMEVLELYEEGMFTAEARNRLNHYTTRFSEFGSVQEVAVPPTLNATLRDYQKHGLNWLLFLDEFGWGGCLADDMGLGKTIQVIAFILALQQKRPEATHLVIVPTSLVTNWQMEVGRFAPSLKMHTLYGANRTKNSAAFPTADIVLSTYGTLLSDIGYLKKYPFDYVFLDESQAIKNMDSQRYQAACLLQSRNRIVLTGTPIENNTLDIYGQFSFACPGLLGSKHYFKDIYSIPIDTFGHRKRAKELQKKISPFLLRRTKKQVATELPDKTEMVIYCEMGEEQKRIYHACEKELREYIKTKNEGNLPKESMYVLKGITKLRQICDSPALIKEEAFYGEKSAKIETLMEQIENKSHQHKILVFSQFVTMLDLIKKELVAKNIRFEYLTGQTKNRAQKVANFQHEEDVRVFLISLKAGGVGLNLTKADYVYLVDPWWNPAVENQAIDRAYRIGQKKNVVAVRLICPDTIEEKMMKLQASKKDLANELIRTDASILKSLSKQELLELLHE